MSLILCVSYLQSLRLLIMPKSLNCGYSITVSDTSVVGYQSLHIVELLSVQCLQVDDVIRILSPAVYCGFGRCDSKRFTWWHYFLLGV